jgi:hypothetical protein
MTFFILGHVIHNKSASPTIGSSSTLILMENYIGLMIWISHEMRMLLTRSENIALTR